MSRPEPIVNRDPGDEQPDFRLGWDPGAPEGDSAVLVTMQGHKVLSADYLGRDPEGRPILGRLASAEVDAYELGAGA